MSSNEDQVTGIQVVFPKSISQYLKVAGKRLYSAFRLRLGDFRAVLPIIQHSLLSFSRHVSENLLSHGYEVRPISVQSLGSKAFPP